MATFRSLRRFLQGPQERPRGVAVCLLFHRVVEVKSNEIGPNPQLALAPDVFEQIVAHISKHFNPISMSELVERLRAKRPLPQRAIVVTFDDGFYDTWATAYPILTKYQVPATVYVTTGFIDGTVSPYEVELARVIQSQDEIRLEWNGREYRWELHSHVEQEACYRTIKKLSKPMLPDRRRQLLGQMMEGVLVPEENDLFMTWGQVQELDRDALITVGAHTHSHSLLTVVSPNDAVREIEQSKNELEKQLGHGIIHFSYPYGAFNAEVARLARDLGFESAVTTAPKGIYEEDVDVMTIPRVEVQGQCVTQAGTVWEFLEQCA